MSLQRVSRNEDVESAFQRCRGSNDLNTKALSCSFVIERSKNRSQVERAYNSRGLANMALKNYSNAVHDFTHAMELDKTNAGYVDNRQGAFFALGQLDRALEDANHAMRLAPSHAFVYHSRALIYDAMKRYDDAIHDLTTAISLDLNWIELHVDRGKAPRKRRQI
jgi:tetratricopeptide (TPR) repeat protein